MKHKKGIVKDSKVYSILDVRKRLGDFVSRAKHTHQIIPIGRHRKVEAYLVSAEIVDDFQKIRSKESVNTFLKDADPKTLFDKLTEVEVAFQILQHALLLNSTDRNPMRFYYWAALKKTEEIIEITMVVSDAMKVQAPGAVQIANTQDMEKILQQYPLYVQRLKQLLNSLTS